MKQRLYRFLLTYVAFVAIFALQHPIFMGCYHSLYAQAGVMDFLAVMWHGLRLDMSMAGYMTAVPAIALIASAWTGEKATRLFAHIYAAVAAAIIAISFVVDLCLYEFWGFRLDATPVFYFLTSPSDAMASVSGWFVAGGLIAACAYGAAIYWIIDRILRRPLPRLRSQKQKAASAAVATLMAAILFIPIRGGVTTSTMNLSTAYFSQDQRLNHAAINPLFSFLHSMAHQTDFASQYRFMDDSEATKLMAGMTDRPVVATDSVPRLFSTVRPNVVFVILESFSNRLLPSMGGDNVAPFLDSLCREGVTFTNFWGNSFRTDRGLVSIISGYPAQPSTSIMKFTEKVENLPSMSKAMKREGYDLAYYYGGDANFTNMLAYLVSAGFDKVVSDKDFPLSERTGKWGAHDHLVFDRLIADLRSENSSRPLLRIIQTSSSHEPFEVPYHKFDDKVNNAFAYTDNCLRSFIGELRKLPMWKNTVVVLVPDHQGAQHLDDPLARHRIPLVMVGGAVSRHMLVDTPASQIDIAATLLYQLGIDHREFTFSKNILNPSSPHFAYFTEPSLFGMITDSNQLVYNLDAGKVMLDQGTAKGSNLKPGKAFLQKLYDDLDKR